MSRLSGRSRGRGFECGWSLEKAVGVVKVQGMAEGVAGARRQTVGVAVSPSGNPRRCS